MASKTDQYREYTEHLQLDGDETQLQISDLTEKLKKSRFTTKLLKKELDKSEKERRKLNSWSHKIPFVFILINFVLMGFASYFYPKLSGIEWIWHGEPDLIADRFLQPLEGESPKMVLTAAIWVCCGVLWQIFVLVNITDTLKYLDIYSSVKFRFLLLLTVITTFVGSSFLFWLCIHAGHLIESVMSEQYPIRWMLASIVMVLPLIAALMFSGNFPASDD